MVRYQPSHSGVPQPKLGVWEGLEEELFDDVGKEDEAGLEGFEWGDGNEKCGVTDWRTPLNTPQSSLSAQTFSAEIKQKSFLQYLPSLITCCGPKYTKKNLSKNTWILLILTSTSFRASQTVSHFWKSWCSSQ